MRYAFKCNGCSRTAVLNVPVESRNDQRPCECGGSLSRDMAGELRGKRIITWKYWCDSTGYDFAATNDEIRAIEKRYEDFKMPEKKANPFQEAREMIGAV